MNKKQTNKNCKRITPKHKENRHRIVGNAKETQSLFGSTTTINPKWFAKHKRDYGSPKKASLCVGIYFLLCILIILSIVIYEHYFHHPEVNLFKLTGHNPAEEISQFLSLYWSTEIGFIVMCYVPFIVVLIFTCKIAGISESWKIKQEILTIFFITGLLFLVDTALTGIIFWDQITRLILKLILEGLMMFWTTMISTTFVVCFIRKKNNKTQQTNSNINTSTKTSRVQTHELLDDSINMDQLNIIPVKNGEDDDNDSEDKEEYEVPLGYVLANQLGYSTFLQHCVEEINMENLLFLAHVCYFKKRFLDRIKERQIQNNMKFKQMLMINNGNNHNHRNQIHSNDPNMKIAQKAVSNERIIHYEDEEEEQLNVEHDDELDEDDFIELPSIASTPPPPDFDEDTMANTSTQCNKSSTRSLVTIRTDVAVYNDSGQSIVDEESLLNQSIDWSPSNCLAILTFRMCHNFERNSNRLTLIDRVHDKQVNLYRDENGKMKLPLYIMANNLYQTFIKEDSEYEINLPSKIRTKLHFFFHQNFDDLEVSDREYHEYRLYHIFDNAWAEIWHLMILNSYRRFLHTEHYKSIKQQLELALSDERKSLLKLIIVDNNNDVHIATLIESHNPYKRKNVIDQNVNGYRHQQQRHYNNNLTLTSIDGQNKVRLNSTNVTEMNELKPTAMVNIDVDPLPIDEQVHHFGKPKTKVKKAKV